MDIEKVTDIIHKISEGFEEACLKCLDDHSGIIADAVREQLESGQDGNGAPLSPTYLEDDYFRNRKIPWHRTDEDTGKTYVGAEGYRDWKRDITPPVKGTMLGLPPRPADVPNLRIDGTFHSAINAKRVGDVIVIDPGNGRGPAIVSKYSDSILDMGPVTVEYFISTFMLPAIDSFLKECGYR